MKVIHEDGKARNPANPGGDAATAAEQLAPRSPSSEPTKVVLDGGAEGFTNISIQPPLFINSSGQVVSAVKMKKPPTPPPMAMAAVL